jgi:1,4-alpha-glucan branching enzyme
MQEKSMTDSGPPLTDYDLFLFNEGNHLRIWKKLGAHPDRRDGVDGTWLSVWAPNAERVAVIGDFNDWDDQRHLLEPIGGSGIWSGFIAGIGAGARYKYAIRSAVAGYRAEKTDPYGFAGEIRPATASVVWDIDAYHWGDQEWLEQAAARQAAEAPMCIYEVHLGSWRRHQEEGGRWLGYRELAHQLAEYVSDMGFTHVELLPVSEHPLDASWGYQTVGYYAPTSRFGTPDDFKYLVDTLHQAGIGVILDWVPAHFPRDAHGLGFFDGTHLYEHADPRQGEHQDWGTFIFNYGRHEVTSFLIGNALFWLEVYHVDGLRVDAVASMLYLDYSRREGEWVPNRHGGRENLEAIDFLRRCNEVVHAEHPRAITVAEESTAWPMVSRPTSLGGLGFGLKWNMGWMHDMLGYMATDPMFRKHHHDSITFSMMYAFSESFVLPFSHDEVVHGKGSMLAKMPGDTWQKLANLRLLYGFMYTHPGKKLLFMGSELGQWSEWNHEQSLDWHLLEETGHQGLQRWVRDLNTTLRVEPALHELDHVPEGFSWIDCSDTEQSVVVYLRRARDPGQQVVCIANFTPVQRHSYRIGVPRGGPWEEILNSDAVLYGGSGMGNLGGVRATPVGAHGYLHSLNLTLPPLGLLVFRPAP